MRTPFMAAGLSALSVSGLATAQGFSEGWEFDGKAEVVAIVSTMDDVERLPAPALLGEVSLRATAEKTLENSAEIGLRFEVKAQQDNPARAGFSGNIDPFGQTPQAGAIPLRGAYSGLTRFGPVEDNGLSGSIETAQAYIDGGYGQVSAGLGRGVAARFHEGAPDIFTHARASSPKLDPAGLNIVRTENDLTGPAAKISYQTPRYLGIRAGLSFTPDAHAAGIDRDPRRAVPGVVTPDIKNVTEGAVQFSRKLQEPNVRIRTSASYAQGEISGRASTAELEDVTVWTIGAEFEFETMSLGAEYLSSNNGLRGEGDYSAWSAGITKEAFGWVWGVRYGESEDENIQSKGRNWSVGGSTKISHNVKIAAGYQKTDVDFGQIAIGGPDSAQISAPEGVVVEITLSL